MTLDEPRNLIAAGESQTLEWKASTGQRSRAMETLCAMLNGEGGRVVFGVTPEGRLTGQEVGDDTLAQLAAEIREIQPAVVPDLDVVPVAAGRSAIVLTVPGGGGPFTYRRKPFLRLGPTTSEMPAELYELRIAEKLHGTTRWENQPCPPDVTLADLDADEIRQTVQTAQRLGRLGAVPAADLEAILTGLDLMADGRLLNAAVALFANPTRSLFPRYPQLSLRLGRFRGKDRLADFADNRDYWGGAFALLRQAERFLVDHVRIAGRVVPGKLQREDFPDYPPRATREALANAFCHRDYTMAGGAVEVAMYDDHLEITNPGEFHFGITPESLRTPHASRPWNPIIASVLHRAGVIERWGSGALNIVDWCREGGTPAPAWSQNARTVVVTFLPLPAIPEPPAGKRRTGSGKSSVKSSVKSSAKGSVKSSVRILRYLQANRVATLPEVAARLGLTKRAIEMQVRKLREAGRLQRVGPDKGGHWQVVESPKNGEPDA
jgi:ATP-dependent DNA helicase RecG